jgi:hypothetical protein
VAARRRQGTMKGWLSVGFAKQLHRLASSGGASLHHVSAGKSRSHTPAPWAGSSAVTHVHSHPQVTHSSCPGLPCRAAAARLTAPHAPAAAAASSKQ